MEKKWKRVAYPDEQKEGKKLKEKNEGDGHRRDKKKERAALGGENSIFRGTRARFIAADRIEALRNLKRV